MAESGTFWGIILGSISGVLIAVFKEFITKWLILIIPQIFIGSTRKKALWIAELRSHQLFSTFNRYIAQTYTMQFINKYKTLVGRDLFYYKLVIGKKYFKEYINKVIELHKHLTHEDARRMLFEYIQKILEECRHKWKEQNINPYIIEKFEEYHNNNVEVLTDHIMTEFQNTHKDVLRCVNDVLDYTGAVYDFAKHDIQKVINQANGRVADDVYKGVKNTNEVKNYGKN